MHRPQQRTVSSSLAIPALALLAAAGAVRTGHAARPVEDQLTPVLARVLARPAVVVQSDGVWRLPYEIELVNVTDVPIAIESVEVRDPARGDAVVTTLAGDQIAANLSVAGKSRRRSAPGRAACCWSTRASRAARTSRRASSIASSRPRRSRSRRFPSASSSRWRQPT